MHWHAAQDSNLDLSVLEADALTIKLATHSLLAAGAGLEPAQHAMVVRISNALPYQLGQPAFGGRDRNRTCTLEEGWVTATWAHYAAQHVRFTLVRRPGLEPGSAGVRIRCSDN